MVRHFLTKRKFLVVVVRASLLLFVYQWASATYGGIQQSVLVLVQRIMAHSWSMLIYICLYLIRPFTFVPVGWLSIIAGSLWGWWPGLAIALGGELASACIAFANGRAMGPEGLQQAKLSSFGKLSFVLLRYPLGAVIFSRLSPLPDDIVNYGRGMLRISRSTYIRGSLIGNMFFSALNVMIGRQIDIHLLLSEGWQSAIHRPVLVSTIIVYLTILIVSWIIFRNLTSSSQQGGNFCERLSQEREETDCKDSR